MHVNALAGDAYTEYKNLVDAIKKKSYGELYGIGMKIPKDESQQYKVILRIFDKMFKKELTPQRVEQIINKIEIALRKVQE